MSVDPHVVANVTPTGGIQAGDDLHSAASSSSSVSTILATISKFPSSSNSSGSHTVIVSRPIIFLEFLGLPVLMDLEVLAFVGMIAL